MRNPINQMRMTQDIFIKMNEEKPSPPAMLSFYYYELFSIQETYDKSFYTFIDEFKEFALYISERYQKILHYGFQEGAFGESSDEMFAERLVDTNDIHSVADYFYNCWIANIIDNQLTALEGADAVINALAAMSGDPVTMQNSFSWDSVITMLKESIDEHLQRIEVNPEGFRSFDDDDMGE